MGIESMRQYLGAVSIFGDPTAGMAVVAILGVDLALTLVHVAEEFRGRLWGYFGGIVGVQIPDTIGIPLFTVSLTLVLWAVAFAGIGGVAPTESYCLMALGALIGGRLSDGIFSHLRLRKKYAPNPGMKSTPYYFAEAALLAVLFSPGLWSHVFWAGAGFVIGFSFFYAILPVLHLFPRSHEPWEPGKPRPDWAD